MSRCQEIEGQEAGLHANPTLNNAAAEKMQNSSLTEKAPYEPGHDDGGGRCHSCATRNDGGGRRRSIDSASPAPASSGADSSFRNTEFVLSRQSWSKCQIEENSSSRSARARSRPEPQKALDTQMRRSVGQEGNFPLRKPLIIRETRKQSRPLFGSASGLGTRRPIYARCAAIYGVRLFTGARPA